MFERTKSYEKNLKSEFIIWVGWDKVIRIVWICKTRKWLKLEKGQKNNSRLFLGDMISFVRFIFPNFELFLASLVLTWSLIRAKLLNGLRWNRSLGKMGCGENGKWLRENGLAVISSSVCSCSYLIFYYSTRYQRSVS